MAFASIVRGIQRVAAAVALTPGGVHVEGDVAPELIAEGVAIHAHVSPHVVVLGAKARGGEMVYYLRQVEQIEDGVAPHRKGGSLIDAIGQLQVIGPGRIVVRLELLEDAGAEEIRFENADCLVERARRVVAHALHLLLSDDVVVESQLIELPVELEPHRVVVGGGHADLVEEPEAEMLAQVGGVQLFGQEGGLERAPTRTGVTKLVAADELDAVRLLVQPGGGVAAQFHVNIIVELAIVENGHPSAAL